MAVVGTCSDDDNGVDVEVGMCCMVAAARVCRSEIDDLGFRFVHVGLYILSPLSVLYHTRFLVFLLCLLWIQISMGG